MKLTKKQRELLLKIARAREIAKECHKKYGGSFYPFLSGAYEGVFAELLGIDDFDVLLKDFEKKVGEKNV